MSTLDDIRQLQNAFGTQVPNEKLVEWARAAMQKAYTQPIDPGIGPAAGQLSQAYDRLGAKQAAPSAAVVKLQKWIVESIGEIPRMYADIVLLSPRWHAKLLPYGLPLLGTAFGMFFGDANVVCVRFQPPKPGNGGNGNPTLGPEAVYAIPQSILDELTAEDVAVALDGTSK